MRFDRWLGPLVVVLTLGPSVFAQTQQPKFSFTVDDRCLGLIIDASTNSPIGSGFILEENNTLITARHVAIDLKTNQPRKIMYQLPGVAGRPYIEPLPLTPIKDLDDADIAIMHIDGTSPCKQSFKRSSVNVQAGYWVIYAGFDPPTGSLKISSHSVHNINIEGNKKFIEIEGDAVPGYSGGPIFDQEGDILGVVLKGRLTSASTSIFEAISVEEIPESVTK